jgi:hypothetical protein
MTDDEILRTAGRVWNVWPYRVDPVDTLAFARAVAAQARREALEEATKVCDAADKSAHPSDLADAIRALAQKEQA